MGERYETVTATGATCQMLHPDSGLDDHRLDGDHGLVLGDPTGTALVVTGTHAEILAFLDRARDALAPADRSPGRGRDFELDDLDLDALNELDAHDEVDAHGDPSDVAPATHAPLTPTPTDARGGSR